MQDDLFGSSKLLDPVPLQALAERGVFVGTSSWKYPGWFGLLYDRSNYIERKKFSNKRFESGCLTEYARVFPTVGVDQFYYAWPKREQLEAMRQQVPPHFQFGFKVTSEVSILRFDALGQHAKRAGQENPDFLNADRFVSEFLEPLEAIRPNVGPLIFSFSRFEKLEFSRGSEFMEQLDAFFGKIPKGWQYSVELRNKEWLVPEYLAMLERHGVAHCFNSWTKMPPVSQQIATPGSFTAQFFTARYLLKPGRSYAEAESAFEPYAETKDPDQDARDSMADLLTPRGGGRKGFIYVNNRLEGNALQTILAALRILSERGALEPAKLGD